MAAHSHDNNSLTIQLLSFDRTTQNRERFYFLEMATLQATILLPEESAIVSCNITAYTNDNKYWEETIADDFKTIGDFNSFFIHNTDYYIHDCEITLENGLIITSHDDGEVSIELPDNSDQPVIARIFESNGLTQNLMEIIKSKPGQYIAIDNNSNIIAEYKSFEDYITNGRV